MKKLYQKWKRLDEKGKAGVMFVAFFVLCVGLFVYFEFFTDVNLGHALR